MRDIIITDVAERINAELSTSELLNFLHEHQDELDHNLDIVVISNNKQDIELHLSDSKELIEAVNKLDLEEGELFWYNSVDETVGNEDEDSVSLGRTDLEAIANFLYDNPDVASIYNVTVNQVATLPNFLADNMNELSENDLRAIHEEYFKEIQLDDEEDADYSLMISSNIHTLSHHELSDIFSNYFTHSSSYTSNHDDGYVLFN